MVAIAVSHLHCTTCPDLDGLPCGQFGPLDVTYEPSGDVDVEDVDFDFQRDRVIVTANLAGGGMGHAIYAIEGGRPPDSTCYHQNEVR